jgi:hypothetical protein
MFEKRLLNAMNYDETELSGIDEVRAFVGALAPPKVGFVRVFRGQSRDYGTVVPSSLRNPEGTRSRAIWRAYAHYIAEGFWREDPEQADLPDAPIEHPLEIFAKRKGIPQDQIANVGLIWIQAIVQHYGPGAPYLDVTHSLDVALWFALHRFERADCPATMPPGFVGGEWYRYGSLQETGHLYVIDAERWTPEKIRRPGVLVDLLDAPEIFHSPRITRQSSCLVFADEGKPDLQELCVSSKKIRFRKGEVPERSYHELFPGPEVDSWYKRVLCAPFVPRTQRAEGMETSLQHSLPVTIYVPHPSFSAPLSECFRSLEPPSLFPAFRSFVDIVKYRSLLPHASEEQILNPLAIALEGPIIYTSPQPMSQMWHEGLLAFDRPREVPLLSEGKFDQFVPTTNVFIEFSPLEYGEWHKGSDRSFPRAIWIMDDQTQLVVTLFVQQDRSNLSESGVAILGPVQVCYSVFDEQFIWKWFSKSEWEPSSASPGMSKCLYVALELLRHLAPWPKPLAIPFMVLGKEDDKAAFLVMGARNLCALHRPARREMNSHALVRLTGTDEPYLGAFSDLRNSQTRMGLVLYEENGIGLYPQLDPLFLRAAILKADEEGYPDPKSS